MTKAAITQGSYVDLRFMPGLKVARVSIDIPIEHSNEFLTMFGAPDRANPVWCAVARLQSGPSAQEPAGNVTPSAEGKEQDTRRTRADRVQMAGMKIRDPAFQEWLGVHPQVAPESRRDHADTLLKQRLGITTKRELGSPGPKADEWDKMLASFDAETKWGVR